MTRAEVLDWIRANTGRLHSFDVDEDGTIDRQELRWLFRCLDTYGKQAQAASTRWQVALGRQRLGLFSFDDLPPEGADPHMLDVAPEGERFWLPYEIVHRVAGEGIEEDRPTGSGTRDERAGELPPESLLARDLAAVGAPRRAAPGETPATSSPEGFSINPRYARHLKNHLSENFAKDRRDQRVFATTGLVLGLAVFTGGWYLCKFYVLVGLLDGRLPTPGENALAFLLYTVTFFLAGWFGRRYRPKEVEAPNWYIDNPLTWRDNRERNRILVGFWVALPSFVVETLLALFQGPPPVDDQALEWMVRLLTQAEHRPPVRFFEDEARRSGQREAYRRALDYLLYKKWLAQGSGEEGRVFLLTLGGRDQLRQVDRRLSGHRR